MFSKSYLKLEYAKNSIDKLDIICYNTCIIMIKPITPEPLYKKLKNEITKFIVNQEWSIGQKIPSEKQLGEKYNISRLTVRRALREVTYKGLIYSLPGKGYFVKSNIIGSDKVKSDYTIAISSYEQNSIENDDKMGSWFTNGISNGLMKGCYNHNILANFITLEDFDRSKISSILEKIEGLIWVNPEREKQSIIKDISNDMPILVINRAFPGSQINYIKIDNYRGSRIVTGHLIELGHTRIGCISGKRTLEYSEERWRGYADAHIEKGVKLDRDLTIEINDAFEDFSLQLDELFSRECTAVFIAGGSLIPFTLKYFHKREINIPDDISIVGFDEVPVANNLSPIMTVKQPLEELGITAVKTLLKIVNKEISEPVEMIMETEIIRRDSCKRLR